MEKLDSTSLDLTNDNIEKLKEIFPNVVTEGKIDFDKLRILLGDEVDDNKEKYQFTWPGKKDAIKIAQSPSSATLRPMKENSKDWDVTDNLYIEGDNLEVLKQLQKTYYGKIKMIYIDPPYNTGKDFVYKDNFSNSVENYKVQSNQGLSSNPETNGRYHSDWLNMMYPRLLLAKNLLTDDGIIFISIDDYEVENLKKICTEIFGEQNFVKQFIWYINGHTDNQDMITNVHEYILLFAKNINCLNYNKIVDPNVPSDSKILRNFAENSITKNGTKNPPSFVKLPKGFPCEVEDVIFKKTKNFNEFYEEVIKEKIITRDITKKYDMTYPARKDDMIVQNFRLERDCEVFSGWANNGKLKQFIENDFKSIKDGDSYIRFYLSKNGVVYYRREGRQPFYIQTVLENMGTTEKTKYYLESLGVNFDFPKPLELIEYLISIFVKNGDIVMDFFSGSGSTMEAIYNYNIKNNTSIKGIMIQLPERTTDNSNICKNAIKRILNCIKLKCNNDNIDLGIKYFVLDSTNIKPWDNETRMNSQLLFDLSDVFKEGRSKEDVLYEIMLKYGVFDMQATKIEINGKTMYRVGKRYMIVCLEDNITSKDIDAIANLRPKTIVFKESGFADDNAKINAVYNLEKAGVEDVKCI